MTKTDKERLSLIEQNNIYIKEEFATIKEYLKEIRESQKEHEANDIMRHNESIKADKDILKSVSDNYVSKAWAKTVWAVIGVIWIIFTFFVDNIDKVIWGK